MDQRHSDPEAFRTRIGEDEGSGRVHVSLHHPRNLCVAIRHFQMCKGETSHMSYQKQIGLYHGMVC